MSDPLIQILQKHAEYTAEKDRRQKEFDAFCNKNSSFSRDLASIVLTKPIEIQARLREAGVMIDGELFVVKIAGPEAIVERRRPLTLDELNPPEPKRVR